MTKRFFNNFHNNFQKLGFLMNFLRKKEAHTNLVLLC